MFKRTCDNSMSMKLAFTTWIPLIDRTNIPSGTKGWTAYYIFRQPEDPLYFLLLDNLCANLEPLHSQDSGIKLSHSEHCTSLLLGYTVIQVILIWGSASCSETLSNLSHSVVSSWIQQRNARTATIIASAACTSIPSRQRLAEFNYTLACSFNNVLQVSDNVKPQQNPHSISCKTFNQLSVTESFTTLITPCISICSWRR